MKTSIILLALLCLSFMPLDPNPTMARVSCTHNIIAWDAPPFETGQGWVYLTTPNSITVIEGTKSQVGSTQYWIANATGLIDLTKSYMVQGAIEIDSGTIWSKQVEMACPKIYLPQVTGWRLTQ